MGMVFYGRLMTNEQIEHFLDHPEKIEDFLYGEEQEEQGNTQFTLDKAWHGIH